MSNVNIFANYKSKKKQPLTKAKTPLTKANKTRVVNIKQTKKRTFRVLMHPRFRAAYDF